MLDVGGLGSLRIRDCFAEFTLSSKTLSVANGVANVLAMTSESLFCHCEERSLRRSNHGNPRVQILLRIEYRVHDCILALASRLR